MCFCSLLYHGNIRFIFLEIKGKIMKEKYAIIVSEGCVEIYGELNSTETFNLLSFFQKQGFNSVTFDNEKAALVMMSRDLTRQDEPIDYITEKDLDERLKEYEEEKKELLRWKELSKRNSQ
jgi:hypothetical protein